MIQSTTLSQTYTNCFQTNIFPAGKIWNVNKPDRTDKKDQIMQTIKSPKMWNTEFLKTAKCHNNGKRYLCQTCGWSMLDYEVKIINLYSEVKEMSFLLDAVSLCERCYRRIEELRNAGKSLKDAFAMVYESKENRSFKEFEREILNRNANGFIQRDYRKEIASKRINIQKVGTTNRMNRKHMRKKFSRRFKVKSL